MDFGLIGASSHPAPQDVALCCPRCGYNLAGLPEPRCPECGRPFDPAELVAGFVRENIPTRLDRCDPWQPHQVLIASLLELLHNAVRPGRVLRRIKLDGPWWSNGWMLLGGVLWNYVFVTLGVAVAIFAHSGVSPGAALKASALWWTPWFIFSAAAVSSLCAAGFAKSRRMRRGDPPEPHPLRLVSYWIPACMLWSGLPTVAILIVALEFGIEMRAAGPAIAILVSLATIVAWERQAREKAGLYWVLAWHAFAAVQAWIAARGLIPRTLDPPTWVYLLGN